MSEVQNNLGEKFKETIAEAMKTGDFHALNTLVTDTVNDALREADFQANLSREATEKKVWNSQRSWQDKKREEVKTEAEIQAERQQREKQQEERRRLEAEAAERAQHPLYYGDLITLYAAEQSLDPALVSAVILCESSFDPRAESRLGARGLMQLMPDTAEWVAHKYKEDGAGYSFDKLYDPETNIRYGTWYLGYLSRRFDGDATKIVCAYHAGQGNVDSWLKNPQYSADGVTLDVIPTQDTATYASRVLRARDVYRKYYFPVETPEPTES